ncbi:MAG: glycogen debranching N-terminal domain-containing protein [Bifidobacterium sp.]|uniref:Glycogen debranching N-terminal domain-containing protein n=1 Tax=Bifidobacterium fermentum TaxID=3059035 RepID=A0AB39UDJ8_9BIFI
MANLERQHEPWIHDKSVILSAPLQLWMNNDGTIDGTVPCGLFYGDMRILSQADCSLDGRRVIPIANSIDGSTNSHHVYLDASVAMPQEEPNIRIDETRTIGTQSLGVRYVQTSSYVQPRMVEFSVSLSIDLSTMQTIRSGSSARLRHSPNVESIQGTDDSQCSITCSGVRFRIDAPSGIISVRDDTVLITWTLPCEQSSVNVASWKLTFEDVPSIVEAAEKPCEWECQKHEESDTPLQSWVKTALDDLRSLRMSVEGHPDDAFIAAGAPWYFTLFGRDSLWAARFLLPLTQELAGGTLRILAEYQGESTDVLTNCQPGKILHELRTPSLIDNEKPSHAVQLPPIYYGSIDSTSLWIILLAKAKESGLSDDAVRPLLGSLKRALRWLTDYGDADGDGFVEYFDYSGKGLNNQGWKDSRESIRWKDGRLASGPLALCEVQGYAYQAATLGAELLDEYGLQGSEAIRHWAGNLKAAFNEKFWISDPNGDYPAVALDKDKRQVDSLTSNIGHLLGTGIVDGQGVKLIVDRIMSDDLLSGYGVRTLSAGNGGYWPLSYHCGSVWPHDSAIIMLGMVQEGYLHEAKVIARQLLSAATAFHGRVPELYSGEPKRGTPIPYPESCHPQGWSAATAIAVGSVLQA